MKVFPYVTLRILQILYKHQLEVEGRKKKALDKHLDFLVGQTERCVYYIDFSWSKVGF